MKPTSAGLHRIAVARRILLLTAWVWVQSARGAEPGAVLRPGLGPRLQESHTTLGTPPRAWSPDAPAKHGTTRVRLPAPDLTPYLLEDREQASRDKDSRRIGLHRDLPGQVGPGSGTKAGAGWTSLADGRQVWSVRVVSEEAVALRLRVADLVLPPGAEFAVFDAADPSAPGVRHAAASLAGRDGFWTATVFAPEVLLECRLPAGTDPSGVRFRVASVLHRYVRVLPPDAGSKQAEACEVDAACDPAWAQEARAIAGLGVVQDVGELFCTGCLVNDLDPAAGTDYLLTANHCVASQAEADDTEFYWFYQTTTCNGLPPRLVDVPRTSGGAAFVAGAYVRFRNDFALLRLRQAPPAGAVFAGWSDSPPAPGETVTSLHHPAGDFLRISKGAVVSEDPDYWNVVWNSGVTEPGSSGSPLFNAAGQVIGQLYGGTSSCSNPTGVDEYGRFNRTLPVVGRFLRNEPRSVANDAFTSARDLAGPQGKVDGNSAGATRETGEPLHAGNPGGFSVWFRWTAPASGPVTFETAGSSFDTILAAYSGTSFTQLLLLAGNDDGGTAPASRITFDAEAGTAYLIALDGYNGAAGLYELSWRPGGVVPGGAANDAFADALELPGPRGDISGDNSDARNEPGEPSHAGNGGGASLWYRWTAPTTGPFVFDTEGSDFDTVLAVYTGSALATLVEVASNDDTESNVQSRVAFNAVAGTSYRIAVDGYGEGFGDVETGFLLLTWYPARTAAPRPANDDFAAARGLTGMLGSVAASNLGATIQAAEPAHADAPNGASVWFRWTAPGTGLATFETVGADFDTVLAVYTGGSIAALAPVASNDDIDLTTRASRVTLPVSLGETYRIAVAGLETGSGDIRVGDFLLSWEHRGGAGRNDNFAAAERLDGPSGSVQGTNLDATREASEPLHAGSSGNRSVWYRWTAPADGPVVFDTLGSTFDTVLAVYRGNTVGGLSELAANDDISTESGNTRSRVEFTAVGGATYQVAVDGFSGGGTTPTGAIRLNWVQEKPPEIVLGQPGRGPGGRMDIPVGGPPGTGVSLEMTPRLGGAWQTLAGGVIPASGTLVLADPDAPSRDGAFYRAVILPPP